MLRDNITVNQIIERLTNDGDLRRMLGQYRFDDNPEVDRELRKDFHQDLVTILLEYKDPARIVRLYKSNQLGFFILRIIRNQIISNKSPYYKTHGRWQKTRLPYEEGKI